MADISPTYSLNPKDYEYDSSQYHLRHIPGIGVYQFSNSESEEQIEQRSSEISLTSELQYSNLHRDTALLDSFKRYYKRKNDEDFTGTDQEAVDEFMSDFAYIDNNLTFGLGKVLVDQTQLSEQDKFDVGLLYDRYDRTNATGEGSRPFTDQLSDVSYAIGTDPVNAIGIITGGIGFAVRGTVGKVAGKVAKDALVKSWRQGMLGAYGRTVATHPVKTTALSGAGWAATYDLEKQALEIGSGMQEVRHEVTGEPEGFDYDEFLLTTTIGAGFGGALGGAGKVLSKLFSKGDYSNLIGKDRTNATTAELRKEMDTLQLEYEEPPITISSDDLKNTNKNFNTTQAAINAETLEPRLPFGDADPTATQIPEHEYPLDWVNPNGDPTKVTVSNIETSRSTSMEALGFRDAPKVTQVTLRDQNGIEYKVFTNEQGGLTSPLRRFKSDDEIRNILDEQDIKNLGDTPAGVMKAAQEFMVKNFTSHYGLGPEAAERMRDAERMLTSSGEKIDILVKKFEKEFKKLHRIDFNKVDKKDHHTFIRALTTNDTKQSEDIEIQRLIPKDSALRNVIEEWRDIITETSDELFDSGAFTEYKKDINGNELLDEAGNPIKNNFLATLQKQKDERTYLHRMYSVYEDPDYAKKGLKGRIGEDNYKEIRKYLKDNFDNINDDATADDVMEAIASPSTQGRLGKLGPLGKKKVDNEYVKTLLGEITDPRQLFASSVFKTKKIVEDYKLKRDLVAIGLRRDPTKRPVMARRGITGEWSRIEEGKRSFSLDNAQLNRMWNREANELVNDAPAVFMHNPFDGIFIDPEYKRYYDVMSNFYDQGSGLAQRIMAGSTFAFNISRTVLSPTTHMRNFTGGMLQNVYNGILPFSSRAWRQAVESGTNIEGSPTYSVFRRTIPMFNKFKKRGELDDGDVDSITRLIELGVVHNGMRSGIFKESYNIMIKDANPLHHLERKVLRDRQKGIRATAAVDKLAEVYEMSDNINKISAFESEFGWLFRAFGDGTNTDSFVKHAESLGVFNARQRLAQGENLSRLIEEAAAKKVNMFTPTYSQLTGSSRLFRQIPIGNFVAFPMEVTRNYANSWRLAARELRSGSAAMRARGGIRAASLAGATGITVGGIGGFSAALNGITDSEREAIESKDLTPEWLHGTNYFYTGSLKDGTLKAIPLAYTDPFSYLSRIAQVAMHSFNENEADAVLNSRLINASSDAFIAAMDPYIIPAVGPASLAKIFVEVSDAMIEDKEIDSELIERELRESLMPTLVKDVEKIYIDIFTDLKVTKWGTEIDPVGHTYLGWVTGMKPQNIHVPTRIGFGLSSMYRNKTGNQRSFNTYLDNAQNWSDPNFRENIKEEYKEYLKKEREIARKVKTIVQYGATLGLEFNELHDLATSFSKSIASTKPGAGKYRAEFAKDYMKSIYNNKYPIKFVSDSMLRRIRSALIDKALPDSDTLISDLVDITAEEYRTQNMREDN